MQVILFKVLSFMTIKIKMSLIVSHTYNKNMKDIPILSCLFLSSLSILELMTSHDVNAVDLFVTATVLLNAGGLTFFQFQMFLSSCASSQMCSADGTDEGNLHLAELGKTHLNSNYSSRQGSSHSLNNFWLRDS
jgi:hypothetical protein